VIFFGELHNNPIAHWLKLELVKAAHEQKKQNLVLGAEMFESDIQIVIDEFFAGKINEKSFRAESRPWVNYSTDIKPLIDFAKENQLRFVATNTPRRYANMVFHKGLEELENLSVETRQWLPPLPIKYDPELKGYKEIFKATGGHGTENLPKSQALKDATMAHFILKNLKESQTMIHFNGAYHSNNYEGIYWYLKQENPNLKILTISTTEQKEIGTLNEESINLADFLIVTPESMTKTH
ncbi:MAG: ChaN family lipoprotein, partial [Bacteroidetes bacterium]|nr:ChaN family lipoprotein [Bacteroidota bacterium]